MVGRITQGMINSQFLTNLNRNIKSLDNLQNQLSSGKRITKPSDDPVGISYSLRYRNELNSNDQYQSNVDSATSWLDNTDSTLGQVGNVLQNVRDLAVQAANGTNPQDALDAIKAEAEQLSNQLVTIGNTKFNNKYVFNGQKTDVPPYDASAPVADTDTGTIRFEIGVGVKIGVNVTGNQVFGSASDSDNVYKVLQDFQDALAAGDTSQISTLIGSIDSRLNKVLNVRSEIGAKSNRIELASNRLKDINTNLQNLQSKTEDADVAEVITNLKMSENVYQASLSTGAQIIRPSLVDYLK